MATKERLYDPEGHPFDVRPHLVSKLLLEDGWTRNKPTIAPLEDEDEPTPPQQRETPKTSQRAGPKSKKTSGSTEDKTSPPKE